MHFNLELPDDEGGGNIIHRASCLIAAGRLYPLGEFTTYHSALVKAKQLGYKNLNGCYWCCFWNHSPGNSQRRTGSE